MRRTTACLITGALCVAGPASANIFETFGAGARVQGMAGAGTAVVDDFNATFHNPAGLTLGPASVGLSVGGVFDRTSILLMPRPAGYDPPDYGARLNARADTEPGGVTGGVTLGFTLKPFDEDFAVGALIRVPFEGFANIDTAYPDEREQYFSNQLRFSLLGERMRSEVISLGLSYRWQPWLSMGLGLVMLPAVTTQNDIYTPNAVDPSRVEANFGIEQGVEEAVVAGVIVDPLDWLRIAISVQDEVYLAVHAENRVLLGGSEDEPIFQSLRVAQHYSPPRLSGAIAVRGEDAWVVTFESTWKVWSRALDEHASQPAPAFEDTVDFRLGAELPMGTESSARFGVGWVPSPVPDQTGRTNYVDNDRVVVSAGGGRVFEFWDEAFSLDVSVQLHALVTRETHKARLAEYPDCAPGVTALCDETPDRATDRPGLPARDTVGLQTGNPGFPGFVSGGYVVHAGVDFKWRF